MLELDSLNDEISVDHPHSSYRLDFQHKINIVLIILLSRQGMPRPKELRADVMPHQKECNMLKFKQ